MEEVQKQNYVDETTIRLVAGYPLTFEQKNDSNLQTKNGKNCEKK